MRGQNLLIRTIIILIGICFLSFPVAAQQPGPQSKQGTLSVDDLIKLNQQITELTDPTFRAFLRMKLLSWEVSEPGPTRRQSVMQVATQGVTDLCEHQNEVWSPTASWLYEGLARQIKTLQSPDDTAVKLCLLKIETNQSEKSFSSAMKMLRNAETSAAGLTLAKSIIASGQVSAEAMLGELLRLQVSQSPHLSEVLGAVLALEEKQPGTLPLRLLPFFSATFFDKSVEPEIVKRFVFVAVQASRVPAEEFAKPTVRGPVTALLNGIAGPAKQVAPELYPEIASRLSSLTPNAPDRTETRLAAEERIQKAGDQLEQLISEANSASDEQLKRHFLSRAARLAKEQGQWSKAVDLAMKATNEREVDNDGIRPTWLNTFMLGVVTLALRKDSPRDATYAMSKMTQTLEKAIAYRLLGEYYGAKQDNVKSKEAFAESAKQLSSVKNSNGKAKSFLSLAESVLRYEPADAYEVFRESVKTINNLPLPAKGQEKMYYLQLLPVAEGLIRSFRLLANSENQTATSLAAEIKLSELRLSALSGIFSADPRPPQLVIKSH